MSKKLGAIQPDPQTQELSSLLLEEFAGQKNVPVKNISKWVIEETSVFLPTHAKRELEFLYDKKLIAVIDPDAKRKRFRFHWPERLLVTFK